ncbi:hypothetical protein [Natronomonas salsuginis]|uniref:Uncharacterized protein n=1 Tax=Natronomonas salsuginis TaxID=2217661 RepID=A0A4U5JHH8_9EURY|nr:hypothetical protein [Natronomonas salsuginis]TKR25519.1 hypothetical protein DM868_08835 [Natronomonas salsuginis]
MDRDELVAGLSQDILTYVMHGSFPENHVAAELKPNGLDERFDDFESLVRLHFILKPGVVDFVEALPKRLRNIKTGTETTTTVSRGSVSGRIDWPSTVKQRYSTNPHNRALFVCDDRSESYEIAENIVLKRLLSVIYNTLDDCEAYLRADYEWVTHRWRENLELVDVMRRTFERNVHVKRIRDPETYEPTDRMLQRAETARTPLYTDAAALLRSYRDSLDADREAMTELLEQTAITPDDEETLLELYVLFRFVAAIESLREESFTLSTIVSDSQAIARMVDDDAEITLYHDNSARERGLSFVPENFEKERTDLTRSEMVQRETREVLSTYFENDEFRRTTGRPDVIVLEIDADGRQEYLITEIKNSTNPQTIRSGIKETLEYLAFLRQNGEFVFEDDTAYFGSGWNGLLVVQDIEESQTAALDEQRSIRILQASEVESKLRTVLESVVN